MQLQVTDLLAPMYWYAAKILELLQVWKVITLLQMFRPALKRLRCVIWDTRQRH